METKHTIIRQGDILLESIDVLPQSLTEVSANGPIVLAEGETTGHKHVVNASRIRLLRDPQNQVTYLEVREALAMLEHDEHKSIPIAKGFYKFVQQREFPSRHNNNRTLTD